jgi:hypothetical protein
MSLGRTCAPNITDVGFGICIGPFAVVDPSGDPPFFFVCPLVAFQQTDVDAKEIVVISTPCEVSGRIYQFIALLKRSRRTPLLPYTLRRRFHLGSIALTVAKSTISRPRLKAKRRIGIAAALLLTEPLAPRSTDPEPATTPSGRLAVTAATTGHG